MKEKKEYSQSVLPLHLKQYVVILPISNQINETLLLFFLELSREIDVVDDDKHRYNFILFHSHRIVDL